MMLDRTNDHELILLSLQAESMQDLAQYTFGVSRQTLYSRFAKMKRVYRVLQGLKRNERVLIYELMTGETSARTMCKKYKIRPDHLTSVCKNLVPGAFEYVSIAWRKPGAPISYKFNSTVNELVTILSSGENIH
jgi:hypothetical protein